MRVNGDDWDEWHSVARACQGGLCGVLSKGVL